MSRSLPEVAREYYEAHMDQTYGLNVPNLFEEIDDVILRDHEIVGQTRWDTQYENVYEYGGRFWKVNYQGPSTEYGEWDDADPYNYDIEEVTRVTKTVHVWQPIAQAQ